MNMKYFHEDRCKERGQIIWLSPMPEVFIPTLKFDHEPLNGAYSISQSLQPGYYSVNVDFGGCHCEHLT